MKGKCCISDGSSGKPILKDSQIEELAKLAWGLAHPARVRILCILLAQKTCNCGELVDQLPLAQSTVSQHLKILKEAGLVIGEIEGPKVCYCVNPKVLQQLKHLIAEI